MAMNNMDFFNRLTLGMFAQLYKEFPKPLDVNIDMIAMNIVPENEEYGAAWDCLGAAEDAVDFLVQEGFLIHKGKSPKGRVFLQARLTLKALAVLGATPGSLGRKIPMIECINNALTGGVKEAGSEIVKRLVQQVFAAVVAS